MRQFKMAQRDWALEVNIPARKAVLAATNNAVDLFGVFDPSQALQKAMADPELLSNTLFTLCKDQAAAASVSEEDFLKAFTGDVIDGATDALMEAIIDFFPNRQRQVLNKALAKGQEAVKLAFETMMAELEKPTPPPTSSDSSTSSLVSRELIQNA